MDRSQQGNFGGINGPRSVHKNDADDRLAVSEATLSSNESVECSKARLKMVVRWCVNSSASGRPLTIALAVLIDVLSNAENDIETSGRETRHELNTEPHRELSSNAWNVCSATVWRPIWSPDLMRN